MYLGLTREEFWDINPKIYQRYLEVFKEKEQNKARELDYGHFNLGQYISYAFNDPKRYPKKPFLATRGETGRRMTAAQMNEFAKNFAQRFKKQK